MRGWIKALLVAALTAWLLMGGLDFLETHYYAMERAQQDIIHKQYQLSK